MLDIGEGLQQLLLPSSLQLLMLLLTEFTLSLGLLSSEGSSSLLLLRFPLVLLLSLMLLPCHACISYGIVAVSRTPVLPSETVPKKSLV